MTKPMRAKRECVRERRKILSIGEIDRDVSVKRAKLGSKDVEGNSQEVPTYMCSILGDKKRC